MLIANDLGVTLNPFDSDRVPAPSPHSGRKRPTEMVDFSLVKKIISLPDTKQPKGIRDRALLALLFGAGLRRGEVIKLRLADVKRTPRGTTFLYLRSTKAKRDAEQAIPSWAANFLAELVAVRRAHKAQDGDYLFVSFRGKGGLVETNHPLSSHGIYQLFKAYCRAAGAGSHVSPHSARATAITRLLDEGVSHRDVQEFSRHASVQMVEVYDKRRVGVDQNPAKDLDYD